MAQDKTKEKGRRSNKGRNTIQLIILAVIFVCIALILFELYNNVTGLLTG